MNWRENSGGGYGIAALIGIAAVGLTMAGPASAEQDPQSSGGLLEDEIVPAFASDQGVSSEEARSMLAKQADFNEFVNDVWELHGERNVDAWIEESENGEVFNVRSSDADALATVDEFAADAELFINVEEAAAVAHGEHIFNSDAAEQIAGHEDVQGMYIDVATGSLVIDALDESGQDVLKFAEDAVSESPAIPSGPEATEIDVQVNYADEPMSDDATIRGGVATNNCTAGFTGATSASTGGFYTAAHCDTSPDYWSTPSIVGDPSGSSNFISSVYNQNADISFRTIDTSNDSAVAEYWAGGSVTEAVMGTTIPTVGSSACSQGQNSGHRCGAVESITYVPTYAGACPTGTCNAVFIAADMASAGGDSGGPVYSAPSPSLAVGIHKGSDSGFAISSRIGYIPDGTNLLVQ